LVFAAPAAAQDAKAGSLRAQDRHGSNPAALPGNHGTGMNGFYSAGSHGRPGMSGDAREAVVTAAVNTTEGRPAALELVSRTGFGGQSQNPFVNATKAWNICLAAPIRAGGPAEDTSASGLG